MHHITIRGVRIDDVTYDDVIDRIAGYIAEGRPHHIVTVNPEFVMEAQQNAPFRKALAQADLATPDGFGLMLVSRWRQTPLRTRVTGVDLVTRLTAEAAQRGWSIFLLGAAPGVAEQAAATLTQSTPGLKIVGCYAGSPHPNEEQHIHTIIEQAQPDVLLVAFGTPAQELWIARNRSSLHASVLIGVGGAFDFIAGVAPRAPLWVQKIGMEWLYRLVTQPWRWRRIMRAVPLFLWSALRERHTSIS
ncbi:MAG: WecB/TagA/CpsF family glycosyltransferase [Chloroflexota bacterium]